MPNELVFSASQDVPAPPPESVFLGQVLVAPYQVIRVLAFCRSAALGNVEITLTHVEGEAAVAPLDQFILVPGAHVNQIYEVPGVILGISAGATADTPTSADVVIWGFRSGQGVPPLNPVVPPQLPGTLIVRTFLDDGSGGAGESAGAGVAVSLDGIVVGVTVDDGTLTREQVPGDYVLEAVHPDGAIGTTGVTIVSGETVDVTLILSSP